MSDNGRTLIGILLPENRAVSLRVVIFAISLVGLGFVTHGFIWISEVVFEFAIPGQGIIYGLCTVAILAAFINGYANDDALVSMGIAVGPILGFGLFSAVLLPTGLSPLVSETGGTALSLGGITAVVGTVSGLLGVWIGRQYGGGRSSPSFE